MRNTLRNLAVRLIALSKAVFFLLRPGAYLGFLSTPLVFLGNSLKLSAWIVRQQRKKIPFDDFFRFRRNYQDRFKLHGHVMATEKLAAEKIDYLEFGVAGGASLSWWLASNTNPASRFYGFDTFEGLPEDWGMFKKGEMGPGNLAIQDERCTLVKGLFQESVPKFMASANLDPATKRVFHMDADLFSSTLLVLISFAGIFKPGDILLFDEFCVPNHEFLAFDIFTKMYNVRYEMVGAVNNYLQIALRIVG